MPPSQGGPLRPGQLRDQWQADIDVALTLIPKHPLPQESPRPRLRLPEVPSGSSGTGGPKGAMQVGHPCSEQGEGCRRPPRAPWLLEQDPKPELQSGPLPSMRWGQRAEAKRGPPAWAPSLQGLQLRISVSLPCTPRGCRRWRARRSCLPTQLLTPETPSPSEVQVWAQAILAERSPLPAPGPLVPWDHTPNWLFFFFFWFRNSLNQMACQINVHTRLQE